MSYQDTYAIASTGKRDVFYFTVVGRGEFPFSMLAFDSAFPVSGDDWDKIKPRSKQTKREIKLGCVQRHGPTIGKWVSYGWDVKNPAWEDC